jgi:hypothetical protein
MTLDDALYGKVLQAYYPNTKVFFDCTGLQNNLGYPQLRRILYVHLVQRTKRLIIQGDGANTNVHIFVN